MRFYLGSHHPHWLATAGVPLFISRRRLAGRTRLPRAIAPWALDSGGFSELSAAGHWSITAAEYAQEAQRYRMDIGRLDWAAVMDWMCEPAVLRVTGLTVLEHQRRTLESYQELQALAPTVPWAPVLQGWTPADYLAHAAQYQAAGIDLAALPVVGIGSVCRRQHTETVEGLIRTLARRGLRLHGFGFKVQGLRRVQGALASADSMAWSFEARRLGRRACQRGGHRNCANCQEWALCWQRRITRLLSGPATEQLSLDLEPLEASA